NSPYAWMANEPSFGVPWQYVWAGAPHKTQEVVRRCAELLFGPTPDGLPGNDDLGATSAWYVWAALGMYPQIPGRAELVLASPLFPDITIRRASGQVIRIVAPAAGGNAYVQSLRVNGQPSNRAWLPERFVLRGGRLDFVLGSQPNTRWGSAPADAPPSFRQGEVGVRGFVAPGRVVVAPGGTATATVRADGLTAGGKVRWVAEPEAGLTVTPASGVLQVGQGGTASQRVTVAAGRGTPTRYTRIPIRFTGSSGPRQAPLGLDVTVAATGTLAAAYDNAGASDARHPWWTWFGDTNRLDGYAFAYPAEELAAAGLRPGATVTVGDLSFRWPESGPNEPNNVTTGATLDVPRAPSGATRLAFLGAASGGDGEQGATGTVRITYTDGSTQTAEIGISDWLAAEPTHGNTVVASTPHVNSAFPRYIFRLQRAYPAKVYATQPITLQPGKQVRSVTLPGTWRGGTGHIFTYTIA
ncbi:MAG TPA: glycoside hydrolase domain-containing protein, partial [Streptosporangiaceae bacterium]